MVMGLDVAIGHILAFDGYKLLPIESLYKSVSTYFPLFLSVQFLRQHIQAYKPQQKAKRDFYQLEPDKGASRYCK